jgi:hypothetical protein
MSKRINLATCSKYDLFEYVKDRGQYAERRELIFAAGALNNRKLLSELGSYEQSRWMEGRRATDPTFENVYYGG